MKYTETHEWVDIKKDIATIGITHYAKKELGDIVYVELPQIGKMIQANDNIAILESTKAAIDIYSPISGQIIEINNKLLKSSHAINSSPEKNGWLCKIKILDVSEVDLLMDKEKYDAQFL